MLRSLFLLLALGIAVAPASAQGGAVYVAPSAPRDRLFKLADAANEADFYRFLEPCRVRALAEFPEVKRRFLAGLPPRHSLFITTRLRDDRARTEQVFVAVDTLRGERIVGRIWNELHSVRGFRLGQRINLAESDLLDWMISRPDGTEEGNRIGKLMDEVQEKGSVPADACAR